MKEIVTNRHGLKIEIESFYDYNTHQFLLDVHNTAKIIVYSNRRTLLSPDEEAKQIAIIESLGTEGINKILNSPEYRKGDII